MAMAERDQWHYLDMPPLLSDFDEVEALIPAASLDALRGELSEYVKASQMLAIDRAEFRIRAEKAESKLAAVGALADEWASGEHRMADYYECARRLKSLIADAGTGEGGT
jgi:hypothetical protein